MPAETDIAQAETDIAQAVAAGAEGVDLWDGAPCSLVRIDADGLIVAVNSHLLAMTGYQADALHGTAWIALLGIGSRLFYETQLAPVLELDGALDEVMIDLRRADGSRVPALLNAVKLTDESGRRTGALAALMVVADRRSYEDELRQARTAAENAGAADARARQRLELLASANTALASSTEVEIALANLARVLVDKLADWCVIYTSEPENVSRPSVWVVAHIDAALEADLLRLAALLPRHTLPASALHQVLAGGGPVLLTEVDETYRAGATGSDEVRRLYDVVGLGTVMVVPVATQGTQVATIIVGRGDGRRAFTERDLSVLTDLGARCGIVIENLRRHEVEHVNSVALQHALLTAPPATGGLEIAIRYLPASQSSEVGGDWYDAFVQSDGTPVVVIGDVMGHDIRAAAEMGQLRATLRTIGYADAGTPAEMLSRTDAAIRALGVSAFATTLVASIERQPDGSALMRSASAGHPRPILVGADGAVRVLDIAPGRPLGIRGAVAPRHDHLETLQVGDTVLLYTDGLIERPDEDLDVSLDRLAQALIGVESWSLEDVCDWSLAGRRNLRRDDIALLAFRITESGARSAI